MQELLVIENLNPVDVFKAGGIGGELIIGFILGVVAGACIAKIFFLDRDRKKQRLYYLQELEAKRVGKLNKRKET